MNKKHKILIVDDEIIYISILKEILSRQYHVETVTTGEDALKRAITFQPELILLNLMLPDINGFEVCRQIRETRHDEFIKILLISGITSIKERLEGYKAGANDFITKPIDEDELIAKVKVYLKLTAYEKELADLNNVLEEKIVEQANKLIQYSLTDELTFLPNRTKLFHDLKKKSPHYFILMNINGFHSINTAFGYMKGNDILKQVKNNIIAMKPQGSVLYRISSDEFVMTIDELKGNIDDVLKKVNEDINNDPVKIEDINIHISFSIGCVIGANDELLQKADIALINAKKKGPGQYTIYDKEKHNQDEEYRQNIIWARKVKDALGNNTIRPFFQGIRDNRTGELNKYECLARIVEDDSIILPGKFINPARKAGLLQKITMVIIQQSFNYFKDKTHEFSINITQEDILTDYFIEYIKDCFYKSGIGPERVIFEVLENISIEESEKIRGFLKDIKGLGCKIAIDDFGSEQSNFERLLDMHVDFLKIDGSFIKNIDTNNKSYEIAKALTVFGHSIGAELVAEFVHSKAIQEIIELIGIDYSQGYFICKPGDTIPLNSV